MVSKIKQENIVKQKNIEKQKNNNEQRDQMAMLHNKFVAYISESKLPVEDVIVILNVLLDEAIEQIRKGYSLA